MTLIPGIDVWQIGNEGGVLAAPVSLTTAGNRLLMGPAERADVIVKFTNVSVGNHVLGNVGPDEPFGGGTPGVDFPVADPATTGQILQFQVVPAARRRRRSSWYCRRSHRCQPRRSPVAWRSSRSARSSSPMRRQRRSSAS